MQATTQGKVCLVTGANGAIGQAVATGLARLGATVILACRNQERGEVAKAAVMSAAGSGSVDLMLVDLSSQQSIRAAVAAFLAKYKRLDVLINNAAVFKSERMVTADGFETMFATNHLGPFLLTLLLDTLTASAPARILTTTAPATTALKFDNLQGEKQFSANDAFGASKMCNLLFTYALARRLEGTDVTANAVHPGLVKSDLMKEMALPLRLLLRYVIGSSPQKAAESFVYLASSPDVARVSGKFFKGRQPIESNAYSHEQSVQEALWAISVTLTKMA